MRIAIFSDTFPPQINGVSHFVWKAAEALARRGNEVRVFTITASKKAAVETSGFSSGNPAIEVLPSTSFWGYPGERFEMPLGFALSKIRKFRPDVIHIQTPFGAGWEGIIAAKVLGVPLIGTHHTFFDHYLKYVNLDYDWLKKLSWDYTLACYNRCNLILSPSKSLAEGLVAAGLKRPVEVVPNFIDVDFFKPGPEKKSGRAVVYMGRVSYEKSIDIAIRSFALAAKALPDLKMIIAGDGPERPALEKLAGELGISTKISFLGFKRGKDLLDVLRAADIFVTASKSENMPLSVLEAMAAGLPVIGVNSLGVPEIVKDGKNGFIVPPDDCRAMADKIATLAKSDKLREKFSLASRSLAVEYSEGKIAGLLEGAYKKAINK